MSGQRQSVRRAATRTLPQPRAVLARLQRPGARRWPRTPRSRCSSGSSSCAIFCRTSTSSSRCGWRPRRTRSRPASLVPSARRAHAGAAAARDPRPRRGADRPAGGDLPRPRRCRPCGASASSIVAWDELDDDDRKYLVEVFEDRIFPVLTPLAVDPGPPVPLHLQPVAEPRRGRRAIPSRAERRFARVKVPPLLPRFVALPDGERFVPLEQVIAAHLDTLFPGMEIEERLPFRVTRNADLTLEEEEADDLLAAVEMELRRRRFGRGRAPRGRPDDVGRDRSSCCCASSTSTPDDVSYHSGPARSRRAVGRARARPARPEGRAVAPGHAGPPRRRARRADATSSRCSASGDVLVHHPYESFAHLGRGVHRARRRTTRAVLAIKLTLYRTSGDSPIVHSLIRAAERGKQVAALVELKARFDEQAQHRVGQGTRAGGRARRLRARRPEDPHKDGAGRARRGRRHPPLLPRRHRQLQPQDGAALRGHRPAHLRSARSAPTSPSCSTSSPATAARRATASCSSRPTWLRPRLQDLIVQRGGGRRRRGRIIAKMNCLVDPAHDRRALRRVAGRVSRSTSSSGASAASARACPGCRDNIRCARSWAATSSTRASSTSPTAPGPAAGLLHRARPTSCPATSTAASRCWCPSMPPTCKRACARFST